MKKIFYSLMALALFTACSNDDIMPDVPKEGLIELASVNIGTQTRGSVDDKGEFSFSDGDKVLMTAEVNGNSISNSFTYNGGKWTQDAPVGNYRSIYVQDTPAINSIVSYGGKVEEGVYTDQSSMESYVMASSLAADPMNITINGNVVTARLDHDNSDLLLKAYDGYDDKNALAEQTPVLKVIVDKDGTDSNSETETYTAWNAGKLTDENRSYTLFRVQLPAGCSILKAELSNVNATASNLTTEILFRLGDNTLSSEKDLVSGKRYSASYTYESMKTVSSVDVSISPFKDNLGQNITANTDWSFHQETKTYTVFTAKGLQIVNKAIADDIANKSAYNITLAADITLPAPTALATSNWTPLGDYSNPYTGTFDGVGHTISNLQINDQDNVALISDMGEGGTVKNLTLGSPILKGGSFVAAIAAWAENSIISNCHIKNGIVEGSSYVGTLYNYDEEDSNTVTNCTFNGTAIDNTPTNTP